MLFDSLGDAAFVIDREGRVVDSNAAARALSGSDEPNLGEQIDRVLPWWKSRPRPDAANELVRVDGRVFDVQLRAVLDESRELSAWIVLVRDVTVRERHEAERRALDHRPVEEQHVKTLSLLAGGLAHDFKSLLTGILGNADLARTQIPKEAPAQESITAILAAAERATELVARMQDYAGERPLRNHVVDLGLISAEMVALLQSSSARHCKVVLTPADDAVLVTGDPTQLRQILLNLIVNAAEAVPPQGTITVSLSLGTADDPDLASATFDATRSKTGASRLAILEVSDTGSGMQPALVTRIFDPFFSTKATGRGLGLSSVLGIVRGHEGALRVRSQPGQGTSIRIWIPAA